MSTSNSNSNDDGDGGGGGIPVAGAPNRRHFRFFTSIVNARFCDGDRGRARLMDTDPLEVIAGRCVVELEHPDDRSGRRGFELIAEALGAERATIQPWPIVDAM